MHLGDIAVLSNCRKPIHNTNFPMENCQTDVFSPSLLLHIREIQIKSVKCPVTLLREVMNSCRVYAFLPIFQHPQQNEGKFLQELGFGYGGSYVSQLPEHPLMPDVLSLAQHF